MRSNAVAIQIEHMGALGIVRGNHQDADDDKNCGNHKKHRNTYFAKKKKKQTWTTTETLRQTLTLTDIDKA